MAFKTFPVNIAGPSYQDRSKPLSQQLTSNMYHEFVESGKDQYVLKSFPGQKLEGTAGISGNDRGQHQMAEVAYRVVGTTLYEVSISGVHTSLGTIPGTDRCIFADDGVNMFVVADGVVTQYSNSTQLVTTVTDPDIVGALSVAIINNQFLYTFPQLTVMSDVGDGSNASGLNAINEESNGDDLVRDYVYDQVIYRFGKRTCPNWWNSGTGTPPIERIEGQSFNVGLLAKHSVVNSRDFIYWLGTDSQVYKGRAGSEEVISTAAISGAIQGYSNPSDAVGEIFTLDDKTIYMLTFRADNKTWCLNEELGKNGWFELSEGITDGRYNAGSMLSVYSKVLVGDRDNGKLYKLDFDTYDQDGTTWRRRRVLATINSDILGDKGKRIQMSRMEFIMETGVGLSTGQGKDPKIMIDASYDGNNTWVPGSWVKIGRLGEFNIRVEWFSMMSFYNMNVRITTSEPVAFNIYSAAIDLQLAGW